MVERLEKIIRYFSSDDISIALSGFHCPHQDSESLDDEHGRARVRACDARRRRRLRRPPGRVLQKRQNIAAFDLVRDTVTGVGHGFFPQKKYLCHVRAMNKQKNRRKYPGKYAKLYKQYILACAATCHSIAKNSGFDSRRLHQRTVVFCQKRRFLYVFRGFSL